MKLGALVSTPAVRRTQRSTEISFEEINVIQAYRMRPTDRQCANSSGMQKYARAHINEL